MARKHGTGKRHSVTEWDDPPERGFLASVLRFTLILSVWGGLALGALVLWYARELPAITRKPQFERQPSITVYDIRGNRIALYGNIKGEALGIDDVPPDLVHAVLAIEDRRFYNHFGIDLIGLARAVLTNLVQGRLVQGGSTITQQLAKNLFLSQERTFKRKVQEALLALWLERELSKDEILAAYLNRVYMGGGAYGVDAAARLYFDKAAQDLTLRESATLAGLLKAPSRFSPLASPRLASQRADVVIAAMREAGYLEKQGAMTKTARIPPPPPRKPGAVEATRYYADWIVDQLDEILGTPEDDVSVYTTLDPEIQNAAENALGGALRAKGVEHRFGQGAVMVMDTQGAVVAMVGGRDYAASQFNRVTQSLRQPGSSFKPILFLTALEQGWGLDSLVEDGPIRNGKYRPENYEGKYYGTTTLESALALSMNTAAVRLMKEVGPRRVIATARRLGVAAPLDANLSLALGSSGVPMIEMMRAYGVFARDGLETQPFGILKIEGSDGQTIYEKSRDVFARRVVAPEPIRVLNFMLGQVIERGTGRSASLPWPAAGKTGTSQDYRDAWFFGFTSDYVAGVWVGNDDNSPMKRISGGSVPAGIWRDVMLAAQGQRAPEGLSLPSTPPTPTPDPSSTGAGFDGLLSRLLGGGNRPSDTYRLND